MNNKGAVEMETKHTPGPWKAIHDRDEFLLHGFNYDDHKQPIIITDEEEPWIIGTVSEGIEGEPTKANASLIAAAPELLEACKKIKQAHGGGLFHKVEELLDKAIAQAEGRQ